MTRIRRIRRLAAVLAGLIGAVLAFAAAAPAALASTSPGRTRPLSWADPPLPPGWYTHPPPGHVVHAAGFGGLPGWQIALLAAGTALAALAAAGLLDRARAARRTPVTGAAPAWARTQITPVTPGPAAPGWLRAGSAPTAGQKHPSPGSR